MMNWGMRAVPEDLGEVAQERLGLVRAVVAWCDALSGKSSLQASLAELAASLGAEAALLVRTNRSDLRPARIATCDFARPAPGLRPLTQSFADSFFGDPLLSARSATTWIASAHEDDATGNPALPEWQANRQMKEFAVLVLSSTGQGRDHIELHFRSRLSSEMERSLAAILPELARVWASRQVGLVTRTIVNHRGTGQKQRPDLAREELLSAQNPAQLSRAEFRVCLLLSRGLLVSAVAQELDLSEATVRSHLRSIYAKTECSCLAELVFRLMQRGGPDGAEERRYA